MMLGKKNNWIFHYPGKTITQAEQNLFCLLTMNHHPIHLDYHFSKKTKFKKNIVVGTFTLSLAVGMSVRDISMSALANLSYSEVEHHQPVFFGDTIYAKSKLIEENRINKKKLIIKKYYTEVQNQKKKKVLSFFRKIMFKI